MADKSPLGLALRVGARGVAQPGGVMNLHLGIILPSGRRIPNPACLNRSSLPPGPLSSDPEGEYPHFYGDKSDAT